jgi:hypothetical protein
MTGRLRERRIACDDDRRAERLRKSHQGHGVLRHAITSIPGLPRAREAGDREVLYAQRAHAEHVLEGLRKAGLEIPGNPPVVEAAVTSEGGSGPMPADQGT